jgi:hypothetical protein
LAMQVGSQQISRDLSSRFILQDSFYSFLDSASIASDSVLTGGLKGYIWLKVKSELVQHLLGSLERTQVLL